MKGNYNLILLIIVIALVVVIFLIVPSEENQVCYENNCFYVEIADSSFERQKGLMDVVELKEDEGMLFIFEEPGIYEFWMKDTLISLDIIWIDENYHVVYIAENQVPCGEDICESINPNVSARYVLEINSGISDKIGLNIGDKLDLNTK